MTQSARLARKLTRKNGLQTYLIIRFLADRSLVDAAYMAYGYFRWLDDMVDDCLASSSERAALIARQKKIIANAYAGKPTPHLTPEEKIIEELIFTSRQPDSKLTSYITNFLSIIEFDIRRRNRVVTAKELSWYSTTIGRAVTDCIEYFIGHGRYYNDSPGHYDAATAAHIVHSLRDMEDDLSQGYINVPRGYYPDRINEWVENRVNLAADYFKSGRRYISRIPVWRRRLAARLYCCRFEPLLQGLAVNRP